MSFKVNDLPFSIFFVSITLSLIIVFDMSFSEINIDSKALPSFSI